MCRSFVNYIDFWGYALIKLFTLLKISILTFPDSTARTIDISPKLSVLSAKVRHLFRQ